MSQISPVRKINQIFTFYGKVEISFYMGESRISSQFLYGIYEDLEFSQSSLDSFLVEWFKERSYSMYHDYYAMIDEQ